MAKCKSCAFGYYCPQVDGKGAIKGKGCEPGYACPEGSAVPHPCEKGTFQNVDGAVKCDECPSGQYQDERNATSCKSCGFGRSSLQGSTSKANCSVSYYIFPPSLTVDGLRPGEELKEKYSIQMLNFGTADITYSVDQDTSTKA